VALKENPQNRIQPRRATQWSHHSSIDRENLSPLLTSINWWSSQKRRITYKTIKQAKGKLEPKRFYHAIRYAFTVQYTYIIQEGFSFPYLDTYKLVGFSRCLHLWWIPLLTLEPSHIVNQTFHLAKWRKQHNLQQISLKPRVLAHARGVPSLRRDRDRGMERLSHGLLRRALLAWARQPLAQRWGSSPGLKQEQQAQSSHASSLRQASLAWAR